MQTSSSAGDLLKQLRVRLSDDSYTRPAFTLYLQDSSATDANVEIRNGRLTTTVLNSNRPANLNLNLSDFEYDTVGRLSDVVGTSEGPFRSYKVVPDNQMDRDHPAGDLRTIGFGDLLDGGVRFAHRRFSDDELRQFTVQAIHRHNISYTLDTVPANEYIFVLQLAHAEALRVLATNAVKRRGLDQTVGDILNLAASYEQSYQADVRRQQRPIPVAKISDNKTERGDVVLGKCYRRSLRTGYQAPIGVQPAPEVPELYEPKDEDCTDATIRLAWRQAKDYDFYQYELWRDTDEQNLSRIKYGNMIRQPSQGSSIVDLQTLTTSKLVFQSFGANSNFDTVSFSTFIEEFGQLINSFLDGTTNQGRIAFASPGPLEPETVYFYRLFVVDLNYKVVSSSTVRAKTKDLRPRLVTTSFSANSGPYNGATPITVDRDPNSGPFTEGMLVKVGDKQASFAITTPDRLTVFVPPLKNPLNATPNVKWDLTLYAVDGQRDIHQSVWTYTT